LLQTFFFLSLSSHTSLLLPSFVCRICAFLHYVESIEHQEVVIILGRSAVALDVILSPQQRETCTKAITNVFSELKQKASTVFSATKNRSPELHSTLASTVSDTRFLFQ
jgi:hypothetical protein